MATQPLNTIDTAFSRLKAQALSSWQAARQASVPYVLVGTATCGRASGALEVVRAFQEELRRTALTVNLVPVGCMGHCYAEPLVAIGKPGGLPPLLYGNVTPASVVTLVKHVLLGDDLLPELVLCALEENDLLPSTADLPRFAREKRVVLRDFGLIDPEDIFQYLAREGYSALARALQLHPDEVIDEVQRSGLRGLGGAGFPAGKKWRICRESAAAHHALGKKVDALTASMTGVEMADARDAGRTDLSRTIWKATAALITVMGVLVGAAFIIVDHV